MNCAGFEFVTNRELRDVVGGMGQVYERDKYPAGDRFDVVVKSGDDAAKLASRLIENLDPK